MNTKKDRVLFCKEVEQILKENSFVLVWHDEKWMDEYSKSLYELKTSKNGLVVTTYGEADHKQIYSVFMALDKPSKQTGNPFSGKVNFHSSRPILTAIADFEDHIKNLIETEL